MEKNEKWLTSISSLEKELECPVCLQTLKPPLRQCYTGHVTCTSCAEMLTNCSLCNQAFLQQSPIFVNNLLLLLPRPCKYFQDGCKYICVASDDHEYYCHFKYFECNENNCVKVPVKPDDILKHIKEHHPSLCVVNSTEGNLRWPEIDLSEDIFRFQLFYLEGQFYSIVMRNFSHEKCVKLIFVAFYATKPEAELNVKLRLEYDEVLFVSTILPIKYEDIKEVDQNNMDKIIELCSMKVSHYNMHRLVDKEKCFKLSYTFFKVSSKE